MFTELRLLSRKSCLKYYRPHYPIFLFVVVEITESNSCQAEVNQGIRWSQTVDGVMDIQPCPNDKEIGNVKKKTCFD